MPLKSRRILPPGGFLFLQAHTGWQPTPLIDFETTVDQIIAHRKANPRYKDQWSTDWGTVANELDNFTCIRLGNDPNYCTGGAESKKLVRPALSRRVLAAVGNVADASKQIFVEGKKLVAGISTLWDWLGNGGEPVERELAERRASICATCPMNQQGDLTRWFTVPASNEIREQIELKNDMDLSTPDDYRLNVCSGCLCPLKTKVWVPLEHTLKHLPVESLAALDARCWLLHEGK